MQLLAKLHDAKFVVGPQNDTETHLNADTGAALFNVAHAYSKAFPGDNPLVFTAGSAADGKPRIDPSRIIFLHSQHFGGANIDMRYMNSAGKSIFGTTGSATGNLLRHLFIINAFKTANVGLGAVLTCDPQKYGTPSLANSIKRGHKNHMHFQKNYPPSPKKGTP